MVGYCFPYGILIMRVLAAIAVCVLSTGLVFGQSSKLEFEGEKYIKNIKQLTFGGENAEAYFSSDGKQLIFQSKRDGRKCDQIYTMNIDGSNVKMVSTGLGRTTCASWERRRLAHMPCGY